MSRDRPTGAVLTGNNLTRRQAILTFGALVGGAGLPSLLYSAAARAHGAGSEALGSPVIAAAYVRNSYVAVTGGLGEEFALRSLVAGPDGHVSLGPPSVVDLPGSFVPMGLHGAGARLFISGAVFVETGTMVIDNRSELVHPDDLAELRRGGVITPDLMPDGIIELPTYEVKPALFEVRDGHLDEVDLGPLDAVSAGAATAISGIGRDLTVVIEGEGNVSQSWNAAVRIASNTIGGSTWTVDVLAEGQGHGYRTNLTSSPHGIFAVVADQFGTRTLYRRSAGTGRWTALSADRAVGAVAAAVVTPAGQVEIFEEVCGADQCGEGLNRLRYVPSSGRWSSQGLVTLDGRPAKAVVPVSGANGQVLLIADQTCRIAS